MRMDRDDAGLASVDTLADHRQPKESRAALGNAAARKDVTPCTECPLNGKSLFLPHDATELAVVRTLKRGEIHAHAGSFVVQEGARSAPILTLLRGWALRAKTLGDGRRQILDFVLPGDLIGFETLMLPETRSSLEALTDCVFCRFDTQELRALLERGSPLALKLLEAMGEQHQELDERLLSIGQRSGAERMAHLLLRLFRRCEALGMTYGRSLFTPFTQQHLADALGLSLVHTNKTLRKLTDADLVRLKSRRLEIVDIDGLAELAGTKPHETRRRAFV